MNNHLKISSFLSGKNSMKIILILGFLGIALIVGSEFFTSKQSAKPEEPKSTVDYAQVLEAKISAVVTAITGEQNPQVMVTLESSSQFVYAKENREKNSENGSEKAEKESEEKYIIVKNADGDQEALLVTELQPEIKGVVIVSRYAGNSAVKENLINAVKTALDLASNKVCVVSKSI